MRTRHFAALLLAPALAGCSFSFSAGGGGLDYEKLEGAITAELNKNYAPISREVSAVNCPRQQESPKTGETFICNADLDGNTVRVMSTVTDDEYNVDFRTLDVVYNLPGVADRLYQALTDHYGFEVVVSCGDDLRVVEVGQSFECTATDPSGDTRQVKVTAAPPGENESWEVIE